MRDAQVKDLPFGKYVYRSEKTVFRVVEGNLVILEFEAGANYSANGIAAVIWDLCDGQYRTEEIITKMASFYPDVSSVRNDTTEFLTELMAEDLIKFSDTQKHL